MAKWLALLFSSRLTRAALFIIGPLLFLLWWQSGGNPGDAVVEHEVTGVIAAVYKHAYLVNIDGGRQVRVFRTIEAAKGAQVRLRMTQYVSGEQHYTLPAAAPGRH